ncbi:Alpha/Beta hydrolase protein [Cladochytrium replicatum]|nr:Alpha/Beta hydrolase protein [Cladochytrium replicatum]
MASSSVVYLVDGKHPDEPSPTPPALVAEAIRAVNFADFAYMNEDRIHEQYNNIGEGQRAATFYDPESVRPSKIDYPFFQISDQRTIRCQDTFGFLCMNYAEPSLRIAFRGTMSTSNWKTNARTMGMRAYEDCFRRVKEQLGIQLDEYFTVILQKHRHLPLEITITGHSLGGALAAVCVSWFVQRYGVKHGRPLESGVPRNILLRLSKHNACKIHFITFGSALAATPQEVHQLDDIFADYGSAIKSLHLRTDGDVVPYLQLPLGYERLPGDCIIVEKEVAGHRRQMDVTKILQLGWERLRWFVLPPAYLAAERWLSNHQLDTYRRRIELYLAQIVEEGISEGEDRRIGSRSLGDIVNNSVSDSEDDGEDEERGRKQLKKVQRLMDDHRFDGNMDMLDTIMHGLARHEWIHVIIHNVTHDEIDAYLLGPDRVCLVKERHGRSGLVTFPLPYRSTIHRALEISKEEWSKLNRISAAKQIVHKFLEKVSSMPSWIYCVRKTLGNEATVFDGHESQDRVQMIQLNSFLLFVGLD